MKPPPFEYYAPASLDDACALLATLDNAKVLAGGQSLMAMLNLRFIYPDHLVDLNRIPSLTEITVHPDRLGIGAMVRQRRLEIDAEVARIAPIFSEAMPLVGHRQTRNRGTVGGSLCHLDPAAELPLLALLYDASIRSVAGGGRARTIPIAEFIGGFMSPTIADDEIVVGVDVPRWPDGHGYAFREHARRHGDFALAAAACLMTVDAAGRVTRAAIGVGGVGAVPVRLPAAETLLVGSTADPATVEGAARSCAELEAVSDVHGHAAYRYSVATALLRKAIVAAYARARGGAAPVKPIEFTLEVNGTPHTCEVEPRLTLADFLRHELDLTGTHLGCENGVCGACTVLVDGATVRSCLMLAVQAQSARVQTVEGLAGRSGLHPLQEAFRRNHGLQCGYCTPGMLMTALELLEENPNPTESDVRVAISGNLCRCTGYQGIVAAVLDAAAELQEHMGTRPWEA